jgi:NTP pyrophosphatase (non-canonical NTP hydrolase)
MLDSVLMNDIQNEVKRARELFPANSEMLEALMEEVGEVAKAIMEHKRKKKGVTDREVYNEIVQLGAMVIRLGTEGDKDHPYKNPNKSA